MVGTIDKTRQGWAQAGIVNAQEGRAYHELHYIMLYNIHICDFL